MSLDFSAAVAGLKFEHPIMNAAGHCKKIEHFEALLRAPVSAIVVGSIMPELRSGNEGEVFWSTPGYSLNSLGIPCQSPDYHERHLPDWVKRAEDKGKHLILNIAGFKPIDYFTLVRLAVHAGVRIIEVNFGCPNLVDKGVQKPIFSYDLEQMLLILSLISAAIGAAQTQVWVKFSPQCDPSQIPKIAEMLMNCNCPVKAVVTTNTFPNGFGFKDNGRPMIDPNNGFGGISGPAMFPIGMGQVRQWRMALDKLNSPIAIVGVGGVSHGRQVMQYRDAGASLVQVGTAYFTHRGNREGMREEIFELLLDQMVEEAERRDSRVSS